MSHFLTSHKANQIKSTNILKPTPKPIQLKWKRAFSTPSCLPHRLPPRSRLYANASKTRPATIIGKDNNCPMDKLNVNKPK